MARGPAVRIRRLVEQRLRAISGWRRLTGPVPQAATGRWLRALECGVLFFAVPVVLPLFREQLAFRTIPIMAVIAVGCWRLLRRAPGFDNGTLWATERLPVDLARILRLFVPGAVLVTIAVATWLAPLFLAFPRSRPAIWFVVMLLYPILVGYPQELVFRAFFVHRYGALFPGAAVLIAANALSFGLYHMFYFNWVAPTVAALGGVLLAVRYLSTGSVLAAGVEHGLWGDLLFTTGLGWYLYSGSI